MPKNDLVTGRASMRRALDEVRPTHVAVAYVGKGWRKLLGKNLALREIVLSPSPGTNPWAIEEIARTIGWSHVHFLEQLHAKMYLGRRQALIGSANLSANALASGKADLYELVLHSDEPNILEQAGREFGRYRALAMKEYRSESAKKARVKSLKKIQLEIDQARQDLERRAPPSFGDFKVGSERVFLEWWGGESDEGGEEGDLGCMDMIIGKEKIGAGDWMLTWRCRNNGRPTGKTKIEWIRVDEVRPMACEDDEYIDQVAQTHRYLAGTEPFELDERFKELFRDEIERFEDLMPLSDQPMPTPKRKRVDALLRSIHDRYIHQR